MKNSLVLEQIDQICQCFDGKKYFLEFFVDLSKVFDTIDHKILIIKIEKYGIFDINLLCLKVFQTENNILITKIISTNRNLQIYCEYPSLISEHLSSIMFADGANRFYSHKNINILFKNANDELEMISQWFRANKLSLNEKKTKFTLFHKPCDKDNLQLQLPNLKINNYEIKISSSRKFCGVLVDGNVNWVDHKTVVEINSPKT